MHVHGCMHTCVFVCMHAYIHTWVYEHLATCVCIHMCMCMHAYMYNLLSPRPSIEVGLAGFAPPPPPNIEKLPTPMISTVIVVKSLV